MYLLARRIFSREFEFLQFPENKNILARRGANEFGKEEASRFEMRPNGSVYDFVKQNEA